VNTYLKKSLAIVFSFFLFFLSCPNSNAFAQTTAYTPPSQSAIALTGIPFDQAVPLDETYRKEFDKCDTSDTFKGKVMPSSRKCSGDRNNAKALLKFPDNTIFWESKLSLDIDGSWLACKGSGAPTSQCPTSFSWKTETRKPNKFVDPDNFPYIVIPTTEVDGSNDKEFRNKTGINMGDLGIVIYKDKIVPVFVADGGPHNKLGEGSSLLHKLIDEDKCKPGMWRNDGTTLPDKIKWTSDIYCKKYINKSTSSQVLSFVFPGSRTEIVGLTPIQALAKIQSEAPKRFAKLKTNSESVLKLDQPTSGQLFSLNTPVTFSGTAKPEVTKIKATIGPGGPFAIAELTDVANTWTFTQTFRNPGKDRPVTLQPFNSQNQPLKDLTFTITIE
jgi:hypothetical protein